VSGFKRYDQAYFDRWYRHPSHRIGDRADLERRVGMVVGVAEYLLGRPLRTVLDVGCGEARWRAPLRRRCPGIHYVGVDSSRYVVGRYGRTRGIRLGSLGTLSEVGLEAPFDLVVCADMLHYVPLAELRRGLSTVRALTGGIAFLEALTTADGVAGDTRGFHRRGAAVYRRLFREAGLVQCGPHCWAGPALVGRMAALEGAAGQPVRKR
jgi:SAM-dependent methyltransferase